MKVLFHIGMFPVHFFGLTIALGMMAGMFIVYREAKRKGFDTAKIFDLMLYTIISGVVGARLFYVIFYNFSYYVKHPLEVLMIQQGGLSIHGGIIGGLLAAIWYIRKHKLSFWKVADTFAPGIILGQAVGRIGCDVFGKPMTYLKFLGVSYQGQIVHPAQVYEVILDYIVFFILWRKRKTTRYEGQLFLWYIILFAINRGIVEFFRYNPMVFGIISISHILSLVFIAGAAVVMWYMGNHNKNSDAQAKKESGEGFWKDLLIVVPLMIISAAIYYLAWK